MSDDNMLVKEIYIAQSVESCEFSVTVISGR